MARATPFELVFQRAAESSFPRIAASLAAAGHDPADRDAFLMDGEVVTLLRDLRPDEGLGEAMDQMVALVHHAYLAWAGGGITVPLARETVEELLGAAPPEVPDSNEIPAYYAQFPERMVWAKVVEGEAPEPLDGVFVSREPAGALRVLGIFGLRPDRPGFSAVEAAGGRAEGLAREDGSPLFDPTLPGAAAAGLRSIAGEEELLELGWRTRGLAAGVGGGGG
ncbi:MAG TPA: hypothetical protein VG500_15825 [Gemmatimonadales bacterium]|jgi:hypothetical protein|nr:hypothetical protein [Gemmatimonadales bacterium]